MYSGHLCGTYYPSVMSALVYRFSDLSSDRPPALAPHVAIQRSDAVLSIQDYCF